MGIFLGGFWVFLVGFFFATDLAKAATISAASCARVDVEVAVASARTGDTVRVPAGTCNWSGDIPITGIQLIGAGSSISGTVITAGSVDMTKNSTVHTRLSGFRFVGTDQHLFVGGSPLAKPYIIDNNYFRSDVSGLALHLGANGGLLHHNQFTAINPTSADIFKTSTGENWSQAPTFGEVDRNGERNIYLEDNTFTNILETAPDGDMGSRLVIRHNTYIDSSIVFHGGSPSDSSPNGGTRQFEVYNNTFKRVSNTHAVNKWIWIRGSTGVIANNIMDRADSPDGSSYPNKSEIRLTLACPTAYPVQYQTGQSNPNPESSPSYPLAIFGNTGAGTTDSNFITIAGSNTAGGPCATPANYIKLGRDFVLGNSWGWKPFEYPHPLAVGQTPTPNPTPAPTPVPTPMPTPNPTPLPTGALPEGNTGIASQYPNDLGISSNAAVLFADDFESYGLANQLTTKWSSYYQASNTRIATETGNFFAGNRALEFTLPQVNAEVSNAVIKNISPAQDTLFVRVYTKFDAGYDVMTSSNHNGIRISAKYPGPGTPPNGSDFFLFLLENAQSYGEVDPGYTRLYAYHPEQRSQWGDVFFPDGKVIPFDATPGNFGPSFIPRANFVPQRNRWYSYELMVKANTPGQRDGRAAIWIDGKLIADFPNLRMRDTASLKIDQIQLELHAQVGGSLNRPNKKYYDNIVVAKSYIGPVMTGGSPPPAPTPPSGLIITSLTLANNKAGGASLMSLIQGSVINLANLPTQNINIQAFVSSISGVSKVVFQLDGYSHTENMSPYALCGNWTTCSAGTLTALGNHTLTVTPYDSSGKVGVAKTIGFNVINQTVTPQIILDNLNVGVRSSNISYTGNWCQSKAPNSYGVNSLYSCGRGVDTYRFIPAISDTRTFDVYIRYTSNSDRSRSVPFKVVAASGTVTKNFNEQNGGGKWILHGRYRFNAGNSGYIETSDLNGEASVDAVRLVPVSN